MPKHKLIAVKELTYMTRHLTPGMSFEAKPRDARVLKAIGKARDDVDSPVNEALAASVARPVDIPAQSPPIPAPSHAPPAPAPVMSAHEDPHHEPEPLDALRAEATALGLHVDRRWGEMRLLQEIDDAREKAAKANEPTPESPETETLDAEAPEDVAMTTDSASALMPKPWQRDEE